MDENLRKQLTARLDALSTLVESLFKSLAEKNVKPEDYFSLADLGLAGIEVLENEDDKWRKDVLKAVGAIETVQGTSRVWIEESSQTRAQLVLGVARDVWKSISENEAGKLDWVEIQTAAKQADPSADEAILDRAVRILALLELTAGLQRKGGIKLVAQQAKDIADAEAEFEKKEAQAQTEQQQAKTEQEHEKVYYEPARDALIAQNFNAWVTGVRQIGRGEWSTPDVVGYYVTKCSTQIIPALRVGTVEVKHRLTRAAIAEAVAHRRFAHYSYVAVPIPFNELNGDLREECVRQGVGLMCYRQKNSASFQVYIDPVLHRPDEILVEQLLNDLKADDERTIGAHAFEEIRTCIGASLFK